MALGWGLWEGPARFIFGPRFFSADALTSAGPTCPLKISRWTFPGSGLIYGTKMNSKLFVLE